MKLIDFQSLRSVLASISSNHIGRKQVTNYESDVRLGGILINFFIIFVKMQDPVAGMQQCAPSSNVYIKGISRIVF